MRTLDTCEKSMRNFFKIFLKNIELRRPTYKKSYETMRVNKNRYEKFMDFICPQHDTDVAPSCSLVKYCAVKEMVPRDVYFRTQQ